MNEHDPEGQSFAAVAIAVAVAVILLLLLGLIATFFWSQGSQTYTLYVAPFTFPSHFSPERLGKAGG